MLPDSHVVANHSGIDEEAAGIHTLESTSAPSPSAPRNMEVDTSWGVRRSARISSLPNRYLAYLDEEHDFEASSASQRSAAYKRQNRTEEEIDYIGMLDDRDNISDADEQISLLNYTPEDVAPRKSGPRRSRMKSKSRRSWSQMTLRCVSLIVKNHLADKTISNGIGRLITSRGDSRMMISTICSLPTTAIALGF